MVADYGQLELRLLAHITNCQSMIDAFASGGCFHSRTAMGMFDHVKAAVGSGECLLEWDYSKGEQPTAPLLKDMFGSERRRAKVPQHTRLPLGADAPPFGWRCSSLWVLIPLPVGAYPPPCRC